MRSLSACGVDGVISKPALSARLPNRDFSFVMKQRGMFSYSGLTLAQVKRLRSEVNASERQLNIPGVTISVSIGISAHKPGESALVVGAGTMVSANYTYNQAPRDGTVVNSFDGGLLPSQLYGSSAVQFDLAPELASSDAEISETHTARLDRILDPSADDSARPVPARDKQPPDKSKVSDPR